MKHTKEEWIFVNIFGRLVVTAGLKGFVIAEVTNQGVAHFIGNEEEAIANGILIAAAPELLQIAIEYSQEMDRLFYQNQLHEQGKNHRQEIKNVIKKATE